MRNIKTHTLVAGSLLALFTAGAHAEIVVIVNPKNPVASMTAEQVAAIYVGNMNTFPDGGAVVLADQPEAAGIRGEFYQKTTGRTVAQIKATWARVTFTGKAAPPKELNSAADVKAFVASDPKAIGYVDSSTVDGSVKAVLKL